MTEEKICPFITRVTQFGDIERHEYIVSCKKEKCMAWQPERTVMRHVSGGPQCYTQVTLQGHCKLIDK